MDEGIVCPQLNEATVSIPQPGGDCGVGPEFRVSDISSAMGSKLDEGEGVLKILGGAGEEEWILPGGVLRCEPAWSASGRFLALVRGERMEVDIYDVNRRKKFASCPLTEWPKAVVFGRRGERIKVVYQDDSADLMSVQGEILLEGFDREAKLRDPVGFVVWTGQFLGPVEANPYGGRLSKNERFLATTSALGVQVWDVEKRCAVDFYEAENQRIDAPTDAWWLNDGSLLVQVPGALEVLYLAKDGQVKSVEPLERVPGTRVKDMISGGDWLVEVREEEGGVRKELWSQGDPQQGRAWEGVVADEEILEGGRVLFEDWRLMLPQGGEVLDAFLLKEKRRVVVVTKDYEICEWDLRVLEKELEKLGL